VGGGLSMVGGEGGGGEGGAGLSALDQGASRK